jgi:hypothetical protein
MFLRNVVGTSTGTQRVAFEKILLSHFKYNINDVHDGI